jgi:hypothetical protein
VGCSSVRKRAVLCACCMLHDQSCSLTGNGALNLSLCFFPCAEGRQHHAEDAHHQAAGKGALWSPPRACSRAMPA